MKAIFLTEPGDPRAAYEIKDYHQVAEKHVHINMLMAPINPADINVLEGTYPMTPGPGGIIGNEGVGILEDKPSGYVILPNYQGCWSEKILVPSDRIIHIPNTIPLEVAASFSVNPLTALTIIDLFAVPLGGIVAVNAANSMVARVMASIAKARDIQLYGFVRRLELVDELIEAGFTGIFEDSDTSLKEARSIIPKCDLVLNQVGGKSSGRIAKLLKPYGKHVTIGAMSREPLQASNALLIFKQISYHGLWISKWLQTQSQQEIQRKVNELIKIYKEFPWLLPDAEVFAFKDFDTALNMAINGKKKVFLDFE